MNASGALREVLAGRRLARSEVRSVFDALFAGDEDPVALGGLLVALASRGESREELIGAVESMRAAMIPFQHDAPDAIDTCGTGGSGLDTFNVSTCSAIVAAAAGVQVIKHGNRSASSTIEPPPFSRMFWATAWVRKKVERLRSAYLS